MAQLQRDERAFSQVKTARYELFIAALSVLAIVNMFLIYLFEQAIVVDVARVIDWVMSIIFFGDFLYRLLTAKSKRGYFFGDFGWADLLSSLPVALAKLFRLFRIFHTGRLIRLYGLQNLLRELQANRGSSILLTVLFLIMLVEEFGAMAILAVEGRSPDANIKDASDSLWYIYVTITTVGYGDRYPVTNLGRLIGVVVMTLGVALFGTLTGFLANAFIAPRSAPLAAPEKGAAEVEQKLSPSDAEGAERTA